MKSRYNKEVLHEAGCDEAGRGCLAGPVYAAAVILPPGFDTSGLDDSKKLSQKSRDQLRLRIEGKALAWAVARVEVEEIDRINILQASVRAMHLALDGLKTRPGHIITDGNYFLPYGNIPHLAIVKGDGLYASIAAASVLAKTHRDEHMQQLHAQLPHYGWARNKGYATRAHVEAIAQHGYCAHHRRSFHLKSEQYSIPFPKNGQ